jgi:hypothetical protein
MKCLTDMVEEQWPDSGTRYYSVALTSSHYTQWLVEVLYDVVTWPWHFAAKSAVCKYDSTHHVI